MTDWRRMEWQYRANVWAVRVQLFCIFLFAPEIYAILKYHFPWWDAIIFPVTVVVWAAATFVRRYTRMYRFDL